ncbi:RNA-binding protein 2-like isoform X2 [Malania oleifera]|uniref:RNA-binding protein 2-like isoform X2 n=1 Tax=Malania oleifera TaxID=397392 RepID=UPI0025AE4B20|nr:RNA-binding protein 2-like isoform X2 [Malania oleifera]
MKSDVCFGTVPMPSFPGYMPAEASSLTSHHLWSSNDLRGSSSDFLQKDVLPLRPGAYGFDDGTGIGVHRDSVSGVSGLAAGASIKGYPSLEDPNLISQRQDVALGITRGVADAVNERPNSLKKVDGLPIPTGESNILFVDGLPNDCTRREVGHLFRPFIGFKEIKVIHKEPRRGGDRAMVFCFVEFTDEKCALTALEALQGYKFDDRKPDSSVLRLHFAHFPFCLPSDRDDQKFGVAR